MRSPKLLFLIPLLLAGNIMFSQNHEKAKTQYDDGMSFYFDFKPQKAYEKFMAAIKEELATDDSDHNFIGACYEMAAGTKSQMDEFNDAIALTKRSLQYLRESGNRKNINDALTFLADYYFWFQLYNQPLESIGQPGKPEWVNFSIDHVYAINHDTLWVLIYGGINHGIIKGDTGSAFSVYTSEYADRENLHLGLANLIESDFNVSTCYVVLNNITDTLLCVMEGDLIKLQCILPEHNEDSIIARLAQLNIIFNDIDGNSIINQLEILCNTDPLLEDDILEFMRYDIHKIWEFRQDYLEENPTWTELLPGGKYDGLSLIDALRLTTKSDVLAFLNYVLASPEEYMGRRWKINEAYATWLLNAASR